MPEPAQNARTAKTQVTSIALQTDSCATLYITKNTFVAYTNAPVRANACSTSDGSESSLTQNTAMSGTTNDRTF